MKSYLCVKKRSFIYKNYTTGKSGELLPEPSADEKIRTAIEHMNRLIEVKGEKVAMLEMRSHMTWYLKGLKGATNAKRLVTHVDTKAEMEDLLARYQAYLDGDESAKIDF